MLRLCPCLGWLGSISRLGTVDLWCGLFGHDGSFISIYLVGSIGFLWIWKAPYTNSTSIEWRMEVKLPCLPWQLSGLSQLSAALLPPHLEVLLPRYSPMNSLLFGLFFPAMSYGEWAFHSRWWLWLYIWCD